MSTTGFYTQIGPMSGVDTLDKYSLVVKSDDPVVSFSGFKSDQLVALNLALQHEIDPAKQTQVYADWSDYALDQAWATQVATQTPIAATTPKVHDLEYTLVEMLDCRDVW